MTANRYNKKIIRILHVDDEDSHLVFTKQFLEEMNEDFIVDSVSDPEEAIRLIHKNSYDAVISDYNMANINGIQLTRIIKEKKSVPVILYTGLNSEDVADSAFRAGVDDYMKKEMNPSHYQVFSRRIKHVVEKHRAEEIYQRVMEENRDGILIFIDDKVAYANNAVCKIYGETIPERFTGKERSFFISEGKGGLDCKPYFTLGNDDSNQFVEIDIKTRIGERKRVEVSFSKITYLDKNAYIYFIRDVTPRKLLNVQTISYTNEDKKRG